MANKKINELPQYTGNTSGISLVVNDSSETTTYKITKEKLNEGLISGSSQISYTGITNVPSGLISGSSQLPSGLISGSSQVVYSGITGIPSGLVSGSSQIDHNLTTNYVANRHIDHTSVTISGTTGLSGGGDITTSRNISLDTTSATFNDGVKSKMNTESVVSGSLQITNLGFATTGSQTINGSQTVNGNLVVTGSITANSYVVSSSVYYVTESFSSGSSNSGNSLDDYHNFTGSVNITGSLNVTGPIGAKLWQMQDVSDILSGSIIDGYNLSWNSGSGLSPNASARGSIRLYIATTKTNGNAFYFNANTRTASDSASPGADTAFMVTTNLLTKVTIYLRQDGAGPNSTTVALYKNANSVPFSSATSIVSSSLSLTTDAVQTYSFTGLTINQFDSIHVYCDPTTSPGTIYGIVTIE
jgi:hypothetical protein